MSRSFPKILIAFFILFSMLIYTTWNYAHSADVESNRYLVTGIRVTVVGNSNDPLVNELYNTALNYQALGVKVEKLMPGEKSKDFPDITFPDFHKPAAFICEKKLCSLPIYSTDKLSLMIHDITSSPNYSVIKQPENKFCALVKNSNYLLLLFSFWGFGLLMGFTPCVLPLLIIMAGFIGGKYGDISKKKAIFLALTYVFTLAITYAIAGMIAAKFGVYLQAYFQKTWIVIIFSFIFVMLALSLLGFYTIDLPVYWRHVLIKYNKFQPSYSYFQVVIMAVLATLIASPCAAAPLLGVLSYVGKTGNVLLGSISLFFVGLGIGTPLLVATIIGTEVIPMNQALMQGIKEFFGVVLMGVAIWLLNNIIPGQLSMMFWSALIIYASILMTNLPQNQENNLGKIWKTLSFMVLAYGTTVFIGAMIGNTNPLYPIQNILSYQTIKENASFTIITNKYDFKRAVDITKIQHKPILLFISADWCLACKRIEVLYSSNNIQNLLKNFMLLKIDIKDNSSIDLAKQFNVIAPPAILFFNQQGEKLDFTVEADIDEKNLITILQQVLNKNAETL